MKNGARFKDLLWMGAGAAVLLAVMVLVLRLSGGQDPNAQLASKAQRLDLVDRMQADLAAASEAEKSAVLAVTDQDSKTFADQARAASATLEQERRELGELLDAGGDPGERESLARFSASFVELQRIDDDLLALAVKNTNVKAYGLAFGPAAAAVGDMNAALGRLVTTNADAPAARTVMLLAFGAEAAALRIQTLLPPHIAEENDAKMDALEAKMATEDAAVRQDLGGLAALPSAGKDPEIAIATARYADFTKLRTEILALSRENTNVRSLSISLNQKRKVMLVCQAALGALQQAIQAETVPGWSTRGRLPQPR